MLNNVLYDPIAQINAKIVPVHFYLTVYTMFNLREIKCMFCSVMFSGKKSSGLLQRSCHARKLTFRMLDLV